MIMSQRLKHAFWAAMTFTVIAAIPDISLIAFVVFIISFIVWWLTFSTYKDQITVRSAFVIAIFPTLMAILYILSNLGFSMKDDVTTVLGLILIVSIPIFFIISTSTAIRIFQTNPTVAITTLFSQVLKTVILIVGVGILFFKVEMYLHSMDGRVITTSVSPSEKFTFEVRKSCCLLCSNVTTTVLLNKVSHKGYSETCTIRANVSKPIASSPFKWNSDETIVSWKSEDSTMGEIDLRKDCGYPVNPATLDDGDPRKFVFISPSHNKILFRKKTCLVDSCKTIVALKIRQLHDADWDNYYCNLQIPNGRQDHGGSMRTEDIPDNVVIAPIIRWDTNETVIYSAFQAPAFSFNLKEACSWK